jgi:hypothetical protein
VSKVLGLVMARNESSLITLSVSHAINSLCDKVLILLHESSPAFEREVVNLSKIWPDKIISLKLVGGEYQQKKTMQVLNFLASRMEFEWIYPFDADEFMISVDRDLFKKYLNNVDDSILSLRYELENWVSNEDLKIDSYQSFLSIRNRAVPMVNLPLDALTMRSEIQKGNLNYFDFEFESKIIFRNRLPYVLSAGSHSLEELPSEYESILPKEMFKVAHTPLLSRERLSLRVEQGRKLIEEGFPIWHGWQSQMVYEIHQEGKLEQFWLNHSVTSAAQKTPGTKFTSVTDHAFASAIEPTIKFLQLQCDYQSSEPSHFTLIDEYLDFYNYLVFSEFRSISNSKIDSAVAERDSAVAERDSAVAERDSAVAERDSAVAERDSISISTIWKLFGPYRKLIRFLRRI